MNERRILVVDDKRDMANGIAMVLGELEAEVQVAYSGEEALEKLAARPADLVLTDVRMPGLDGLQLLEEVGRRWPDTRVVMITAFGSIDAAVEAMRRGAADYLTKPFYNADLIRTARRALGLEEGAGEAPPEPESPPEVFEGIVASTPKMTALFGAVRKVAPSDATVIVTGEHGTGKELVARAIHRLSGRPGAFIAVNVAAVPEPLIEAELFGAKKGAFTGADRDRKGHFLEADGGTLFLDEVGSMPAAMQVKLLRTLQEREVLPVGSSTPVRTDVRIVAAANVDLLQAAREGRFREDLYYRLSVVRLSLPPLRDRMDDVPLLAEHFVRRRCKERGLPPKELTARAVRALLLHDWPGNVRELQSVVERAVLFSPRAAIDAEHVLFDEQREPAGELDGYEAAKRAILERFQRRYVERLLADTGGNISEAARRAGVTRAALHRMLKRLGSGQEGA